MKAEKIYNTMMETLSIWENALNGYSEEEFKKNASDDNWSIGQVYQHIIVGTMKFHLPQVEKCLGSSENKDEGKTMPGKLVFLINTFPPMRIKVPASKEYTPEQPADKNAVKENLILLKKKLKELADKIEKSESKGKAKHPAFGFLNAIEWYGLIGNHFKHHLKQKKRIDAELKK